MSHSTYRDEYFPGTGTDNQKHGKKHTYTLNTKEKQKKTDPANEQSTP